MSVQVKQTMAWDARFQAVSFLPPLGHSRVTSCVTRADVTFRTEWQDAVPLNYGQQLVCPGIYRTLQYSISLFTSYVGYGKNNVQTNHMCDWPYRLHIDVVGTALFPTKIYIQKYPSPPFGFGDKKSFTKNLSDFPWSRWACHIAGKQQIFCIQSIDHSLYGKILCMFSLSETPGLNSMVTVPLTCVCTTLQTTSSFV